MNDYNEIAQKIKDADAILIGASNGLSITEGLNLFADDEAFENLFRDYKEKYGFRKILDGFFFRWNKQEEKWGFFSRLVNHYSGNYTTSSVMEDLKTIVGDKPYFILTSNGEGHFEMSGFEPQRVYELEGTGLSCVAAGYVTIKHILHFQSFGNWQKLKKTAWFLRNFFPNVRFVVLQWIYITHSLQSRKYKWNGKSSAKIFIIRK